MLLPVRFVCKCGYAATEKGRQMLLDSLQDTLSIDWNSWVEHDGIRHPTARRDPTLYPPPRPCIYAVQPGKEPPTA